MTFIALSSSLLPPNPVLAAIFMAGIATRRCPRGVRGPEKKGEKGDGKGRGTDEREREKAVD